MTLGNQSRILITGGTGSFGRAFIKEILRRYPNLERLVIYSRDELKQWDLKNIYPFEKFPNLRFFLGDVRDQHRLVRALNGIDTVVHAAALKQVPAAEENPFEFIKTNVLGADNLIQACLEQNVENLVALSTDKAAAPINLYGATKLCSDKLFIAANNIKGRQNIKFSVVRYGNVMGSRGSVIPYFMKKAKSGVLPITDKDMTRFNISLKEGVDMVLWSIDNSVGGEILVPKIPSYGIMDLADAIGPSCEKKFLGSRFGEKIHEEMITKSDSFQTYDIGKYYVILPSNGEILERYKEIYKNLKKVKKGFFYDSLNNEKFLTIEQIRELIKVNIDSNFKPV